MANNTSYNLVIQDLAQMLKALQADTIYAASRLHLMNTDMDTLKKMEETNSSIVFHDEQLTHNPDPLVTAIMKVHNKACNVQTHMDNYWKTTPNWANGEEI